MSPNSELKILCDYCQKDENVTKCKTCVKFLCPDCMDKHQAGEF